MSTKAEREFLQQSAVKKKEFERSTNYNTVYLVWLIQYLYDSEAIACGHGCGRNNDTVLRAAFAEILKTVYEADSTIRRLQDVIWKP
jgi:hypothetical protein